VSSSAKQKVVITLSSSEEMQARSQSWNLGDHSSSHLGRLLPSCALVHGPLLAASGDSSLLPRRGLSWPDRNIQGRKTALYAPGWLTGVLKMQGSRFCPSETSRVREGGKNVEWGVENVGMFEVRRKLCARETLACWSNHESGQVNSP
jgi:hypothetical protein